MKIIDMNVSLGNRDVHGRVITPELLIEMMDDYKIDYAVAYHEYARAEHKSGNALMAEISKASGGRIGMCAVVDPSLGADCLPGEGNFKQRLSVLGAEAIRIFPTHLRVAFHPFYWDEVFEAANELSMPVIIDENYVPTHVSEVFYRLPDMAEKYPNIKFIIIRYGINGGRNIMPLLCKCKNVYFTIEKMLDYMQIEEIYEKAGCDKLLFGSEYPELKPAGALGLAMYADIPESEREKILYKNWEDIRYVHS